MDRRISLCKIKKIDQKSWIQASFNAQKQYIIIETNIIDQKFDDIFGTG